MGISFENRQFQTDESNNVKFGGWMSKGDHVIVLSSHVNVNNLDQIEMIMYSCNCMLSPLINCY